MTREQESNEAAERVVRAAIEWWRSLCPVAWLGNEQIHLDNPGINTQGEFEAFLAAAVAEYLRT